MIATIDVADLGRRGRTEIVRLNLALDGGEAEELVPRVKGLMTQMGDVVAIPANNHLVLIDTVGSLREIVKTLRTLGNPESEAANRYTHQCRYIKAREAERVLRDLFGLPPQVPAEVHPFIRLQMMERAQQRGDKPNQQPPPAHPFAVASTDEANVVIVTGPADKVAQAKQTLIDLETKAQ